jgi:hypothetical protein
MIVTLDAYSGVPNPWWELSEKDGKQLVDRPAHRALDEPSLVDGILGYRGLVVEARSDDQLPEGMPSSFRISGPLPKDYKRPESKDAALSAKEADDTASFLLNTGREHLDEGLFPFIEEAIRMRAQGPAAERAVEDKEALKLATAVAPCIIQNTPYNPGFWNQPNVQPYNNCYNYSMNWRSDTFAQPGRISGHQWTAINCSNVGAAASWDGCRTTCFGSNKNVALVIAPGPGFIDYHWYRRHSQGFWGHKPGGTAARNIDNAGRLIDGVHLTPANCNRGPYTIFCGYRFSPTGMRVR